jgi:anti-anti-sigma regulatory factor
MFLAAHEKAKGAGTTLTLDNIQPSVARVLRICGVDKVLDITA